MKKRYRFRIYPTEEQKQFLAKTFGCCRYVYNRALTDAKLEYENYLKQKEAGVVNLTRPTTTGYDFVNKLHGYKTDPNSLWLNEAIAVALQQSMLHLGTTYSRFFKERKGYPRFKKKTNHESFSLMGNAFRLLGKDLYIARLKTNLKINWHRELPSTPSSLTITKTPSGKYFVSFVCEFEPKKTSGTKITGIDLGLSSYATLSDGMKIENPRYLKKYEKKLARAQRRLSRRVKGSKNRNKARIEVAKCHERISNCRQDHLHKLSRRLVNENQVIGLEALVPRNMVKNRHLAKPISDASWGTFKNLLLYKTVESQHCTVVIMDTWYPSSHICNHCGTKRESKLKLSQRSWTCDQCNTKHDRDINAAMNIRQEAIKAYQTSNKDVRILLANNSR